MNYNPCNHHKYYANDVTLPILYVHVHEAVASVYHGNARQHTGCPAAECQGECGLSMNVQTVGYFRAESPQGIVQTRHCVNSSQSNLV